MLSFGRPSSQPSSWHLFSLPYDQLQFWSGAPDRSPGGAAGAVPLVTARSRSERSRRDTASSRRVQSKREYRSRIHLVLEFEENIISRRPMRPLCYWRTETRLQRALASCERRPRPPTRRLRPWRPVRGTTEDQADGTSSSMGRAAGETQHQAILGRKAAHRDVG